VKGLRRLGWGGVAICLVASLIAAYQAWLFLGDPLYGNDSGYRVFFADRPVVKIGNRIWLPFLQVHIWLYHLLGLPAGGVKLISTFYSFGAQRLNLETGPLMQEPIGVALFCGFLLLASNGSAFPWIGVLCAAAMMTRDTYWIYLFAATLVAWRSIIANRRRLLAYTALWAVPILWLAVCVPAIYLAAYSRLPSIPIEWPLMYNAAGPASRMSAAESLWLGLVRAGVLPLAAGIAAGAATLAFWARSRFLSLFDFTEFSKTAVRAAPVAIAIVYGLVWIVDPWQVTPGNPRAGWPLLEVCFAVAPLLVQAAGSAPPGVRLFVTAAIVVGLAAGLQPGSLRYRAEKDEVARREQDRLKQALAAAALGLRPRICLVAGERWSVFRDLDTPLFHEQKIYVPATEEVPQDCDAIILEDGIGLPEPQAYDRIVSIQLPERRWSAYARRQAGATLRGPTRLP